MKSIYVIDRFTHAIEIIDNIVNDEYEKLIKI